MGSITSATRILREESFGSKEADAQIALHARAHDLLFFSQAVYGFGCETPPGCEIPGYFGRGTTTKVRLGNVHV
jgi:hypothetical protein